jgi:hypothetical protein
MSRWLLPIVLLWALCGVVNAGVFHDPALNWQTIESQHFRIHYHDGEAALAQRFWPKAEHVYGDICAFLNWYPQDKTDVVLTDEFDLSNGYTRVFPYNSVVLFVAAPDEINSLEDYDDWLALVFRHEFLHVVHLDKVRGLPQDFQHVFGRHPLLFPNAYQPRWVIEGLATYAETNTQEGVGRGQDAYFDMLMRMESLSGFKPIRRVNQPISSWPAGDTPYLYGVFFFEFVHDKYGEQAIKQLVENYSDNIIPFRINSNSVSVFQKELPQLWDEYQAWLKHKYAPVIARVKQAGIREGNELTSEGYRAGPLQALGNKIYFYQFTGKTHATINVIEGDAPAKKLLDVNLNARFSLHKDKGLLITQPEICRNARLYFDIYRADADGRHFKRLTECARYRYAIWSGKGDQILAVHNEMGNNALQLLDADAHVIETLWQGKNEEQIGQMTSSEAQTFIVASVWRPGSGWNLEKFDLQSKQWTALTHDHNIETQPQFSPDGQGILYSADSDGIYNLYQYDLKTGEIAKLTNLLGGAFYPAMAKDRLAYIGYSVRGFDVYALKTIKPEPLAAATQDNDAPMPDTMSTSHAPQTELASKAMKSDVATAAASKADTQPQPASTLLPSQPYSPWHSLKPTYWSPDFLIDDQRTQLGLSTTGNDVLLRHQYGAALAYDFKNDVTVGNVDYVYDGLWPIVHIGLARGTSIYVDGNNTPELVRANDDAVLETILPFFSVDQKVFLQAALIKQTDHDIWSNGISSLSDTHNDLAAIALRYNSAKTYPLSISRNEGRDLRLIYEDSDVYGDSLNKGQITVGEWREFIHLGGEHVLALRLTEGHGENNPTPFRLGGIQSNNTLLSVITHGQVEQLFNKRNYSLRGYSEGHAELIGRSMRLLSAEYRFPISRIEYGWMVPPIGINQLHGTLFYDAGGVWNTGSGPDHYYTGAGFELDADLDVFYNVRLRTSLGFAKGLDNTLGENKVYLRIGSQF